MKAMRNTIHILESYRHDFSILSQKVNGNSIVYLDSASSAQKPKIVIDKITDLYNTTYANIHRGLYKFSQVITEEYEAVRF